MNETRTRGVLNRPVTTGADATRSQAATATAPSRRPHPPVVSGVRRGLYHGPRVWQGPATF